MMPFQFSSTSSDGANDVVVPAHIANKAELLALLARAVPLPDYFGHNWDALEECLVDLNWLDRPQIVLVHRDIPLPHASADQRFYLEILAHAAEKTERLVVLFPEHCRPHLIRILSAE